MAFEEKNAGTGTDGGEFANSIWTDSFNIVSSNNSYAVVGLSGGDFNYRTSNTLSATNFSFAIPSLATIDGIICTVERKASLANTITDYSVQILKNGSVPSGSDDKQDGGTFWSTTEGDVSYGSPTDLWNTTWSASDINNSNFGFAVRCEYIPAYSNASAFVDLMYIRVYYTVNNIRYSTTGIKDIYYGTTKIQSIYYGATQII